MVGGTRQEWRKSSNPRQAAPCSANIILSVCKVGNWRVPVDGMGTAAIDKRPMTTSGIVNKNDRNAAMSHQLNSNAGDLDFAESVKRDLPDTRNQPCTR
jgi:hypothetical protein